LFHRFAAACSVASVVIATGALMTLVVDLPPAGVRALTTAWCLLPVVWGLWAMVAPAHWVPARLPLWGAILGVGAGIVAGPVLDIPSRMGGPSGTRWLARVAGPILYYVLWLLVGTAHRALHMSEAPARPRR
jgi:hypothetical protein